MRVNRGNLVAARPHPKSLRFNKYEFRDGQSPISPFSYSRHLCIIATSSFGGASLANPPFMLRTFSRIECISLEITLYPPNKDVATAFCRPIHTNV